LQLGTWSIGHLGIWPSGNHFGAKWRNEEPAMSTSFLSNTLISVLLVILFFALFFVLHFLFLFLFFFFLCCFPSLIHFGVVAFDMCKWLSSVFRMIFFLSTGTFCFFLAPIVVPFVLPQLILFTFLEFFNLPRNPEGSLSIRGTYANIFWGRVRKAFYLHSPSGKLLNPFHKL